MKKYFYFFPADILWTQMLLLFLSYPLCSFPLMEPEKPLLELSTGACMQRERITPGSKRQPITVSACIWKQTVILSGKHHIWQPTLPPFMFPLRENIWFVCL